MSETNLTALLLGSTGLIGSSLLLYLLKNNKYERVYAITRKKINIDHPKLIQIVADYETIIPKIENIKIDHFFSCIGTTAHKAKNKKEYYQIDHDYPLKVALEVKKNKNACIAIVSSIGANANSSNFYLKLKGNIENSITALNFKKTLIFKPSLLLGDRKENRFLEKIFSILSPLFNIVLIGKLKNYRGIYASTVAKAMNKLIFETEEGLHIYKTEEIKNLA